MCIPDNQLKNLTLAYSQADRTSHLHVLRSEDMTALFVTHSSCYLHWVIGLPSVFANSLYSE